MHPDQGHSKWVCPAGSILRGEHHEVMEVASEVSEAEEEEEEEEAAVVVEAEGNNASEEEVNGERATTVALQQVSK